MTDDFVFTNERDPSVTLPKPHRSGLPVLADKRPPLPWGMQPGLDDDVRALQGQRATVRGHQVVCRSMMSNAPRGTEVYVRFDTGCRAWVPLDELEPPKETPVAEEFFEMQVPG